MLSPFLFALYLNELIEMLSNERGTKLSDQYPNVNILLYADDLLLCADTVGNLQKLLNVLNQYCEEMKVNL